MHYAELSLTQGLIYTSKRYRNGPNFQGFQEVEAAPGREQFLFIYVHFPTF